MGRVVLGSLIGMLAGIAATAALLPASAWLVNSLLSKQMEMERSVIYQGVVLGAGFGAVCGALAGLASAVTRALRSSPLPSPSPGQPRTGPPVT